MKLFLFYDDIEQFLVAARDKEHAFSRIAEEYGEEAADELILSHLDEYPEEAARNVLAAEPNCLRNYEAGLMKLPSVVRGELRTASSMQLQLPLADSTG